MLVVGQAGRGFSEFPEGRLCDKHADFLGLNIIHTYATFAASYGDRAGTRCRMVFRPHYPFRISKFDMPDI
jgi:hypothetical protein